jgi:tetratricopeptide (TPR) repeat protein
MKFKLTIAILAVLSMMAAISIPTGLIAQKSGYNPDKELCAKMILAGKEYYERGRYLDAKNFFRKAIEADPKSLKAWRYYDQTVVFALAEKVEKQNDLLVPDASIRGDVGQATPKYAPITTPSIEPVKPAVTATGGNVSIVAEEQEGC